MLSSKCHAIGCTFRCENQTIFCSFHEDMVRPQLAKTIRCICDKNSFGFRGFCFFAHVAVAQIFAREKAEIKEPVKPQVALARASERMQYLYPEPKERAS